jgi:Protein of unknown function (DUF2490)
VLRLLKILCFLLICRELSWPQSVSSSNHDTQLWPEIYIAKKLTERVALAGFSELHIGKDITTPTEEQIGVGFSYSPNPLISFVPFYRWIANQTRPDHHTEESRPQLDVILHIPLLWRFVVNDRNRCELRWIDGQLSQRYGNRMLLEHPIVLAKKHFTPFAGVEWFYDTRFDIWNRTRYSAGLHLPINPHMELSPYYLHQNDSRATPAHVNALAMIWRVEY